METFKPLRQAANYIGTGILTGLLLGWISWVIPIAVVFTIGSYVCCLLFIATADHFQSGELSLGYRVAKRFLRVLAPFAWVIILYIVGYAVITMRIDSPVTLHGLVSYA